MTYIIAEPCIDIKDRSCVDVCPVDCIHEFARMLIIDPEECIDCGACEPECPVEAIFPEDALPDKWEAFVKINYAFPEGAGAVDPLVQQYADENDVQNEPIELARRSGDLAHGAESRPRVPALQAAAHPLTGVALTRSATAASCGSQPSRLGHSRAAEGGTTRRIVVSGPSRRASNVPLSSAARSASPSITA